MKTSLNGKQFIKISEGYDEVPRVDSGGKLVWGHGHNRVGNEPVPDRISLADADALFETDLAGRYEPVLNKSLAVHGFNPNQNQYDALSDFVYELEHDIDLLLSHGLDQVTSQLPRWCHAVDEHGVKVVVPGILARRLKEVALFNTPVS